MIYSVLLITILSILSSCDQRKTLSGEFTLCMGPKNFQVYRDVMSWLLQLTASPWTTEASTRESWQFGAL